MLGEKVVCFHFSDLFCCLKSFPDNISLSFGFYYLSLMIKSKIDFTQQSAATALYTDHSTVSAPQGNISRWQWRIAVKSNWNEMTPPSVIQTRYNETGLKMISRSLPGLGACQHRSVWLLKCLKEELITWHRQTDRTRSWNPLEVQIRRTPLLCGFPVKDQAW